jgi:hypothetical protein
MNEDDNNEEMVMTGAIKPRTVFDLMAERGPGRRDTVGHSSVQAWSTGELFPAVIARVERYPLDVTGARSVVPDAVSYELTIGAFREEYATRADAEQVARYVCQDGRINEARYKELIHGAADAVLPDRFASSRAVDLGGRR